MLLSKVYLMIDGLNKVLGRISLFLRNTYWEKQKTMYSYKQTRILAKFGDNNWYENILGRIIEPVTSKYKGQISSFWFSRYQWPANDLYNLQEKDIPKDFIEGGMTRSIEFRIGIQKDALEKFGREIETLVKKFDYFFIDFGPYDLDSVLKGGINFSGATSDEKRKERCKIVDQLYHQISRMTLHALVTDGTNFKFEEVPDGATVHQQPSPFATVHHLFCNITQVPLKVAVGIEYDLSNSLLLTTDTGPWTPSGTYGPNLWPRPVKTEINMPVKFG